MNVYEQIDIARQRAVPLIGVETPDQQTALWQLAKVSKVPVVVSDIVKGLWTVNQGELVLADLGVDGNEGREAYQGAAGCVLLLSQLLEKNTIKNCYVCILNAQYAVKESAVSQALCLLRDAMRSRQMSVVLLGPSLDLPEELKQDVLLFTEEYPNREQLQQLVSSLVAAVGQRYPALKTIVTPALQEQVAESLTGLAQFPAEQALRLALPTTEQIEQGKSFDIESITQRKRKIIEQSKGLTLETPAVTFDSLAGLENGKGFFRRLMSGPDRPVAVLFVDEIDKAMDGNTGGDLSGVSLGFLGAMLSFTTEWETVGLLLYGIPGTGKTALARSLCGEYKMPLLNADFGAMRGSLVGESEANLRAAFRAAKAVSAKRRLLIVATCNRVGSLAPELEARFNLGSFFFDYPSEEARTQAFSIWEKEFNLVEQALPVCDNWVGREVRQVCELAYRLQCSIIEASQYVVPAFVRDREKLQKLREQAHGRFLDIDKPGPFLCGAGAQKVSPTEGVSVDPGPQTSVLPGANAAPNIFVFTPGTGSSGAEEVPKKEKIGF